MNIIGLMPVYEDADWVEWSIKNALDFVDELLIMEGYSGPIWHFWGNRSKDDTVEIIREFEDKYEKVRTFRCPWHITSRIGRAKMYNMFLEKSEYLGEGDWLFIKDADEFYTPQQYQHIRETLESTSNDLLRVHSRTFCYNFSQFIPLSHNRFIRYTPGMYFKPTQKATYHDGTLYKERSDNLTEVLQDEPMFHYSFLRRTNREIKRRMMVFRSGRRGSEILDWIDDVYLQWTKENAEEIYKQNEEITGSYGFLFGEGKEIKEYQGEHPQVLSDHPFRNCDDVRELDDEPSPDQISAWDDVTLGTKIERKIQLAILKLIQKKPI
jgi:glycosyltransferase involved in cell wall biosynthesis